MVVFAIFFTLKFRLKRLVKDPLWALHLANGGVCTDIQVFEQPHWAASASLYDLLLRCSICSTASGYCTQSSASFPFLWLAWFRYVASRDDLILGYQLDEATLNSVTQHILASLAMLIMAIVVWCWHIFTHKRRIKFIGGAITALASMTSLQGLFLLGT